MYENTKPTTQPTLTWYDRPRVACITNAEPLTMRTTKQIASTRFRSAK